MRIVLQSHHNQKSGYILIIMLLTVTYALWIFIGLMSWSMTSSRQTIRNNEYVNSLGAAEAATETILARMMSDFYAQSLTNQSAYYYILPPATNWPVAYKFSSTNGLNSSAVTIGELPPTAVPLDSQYGGLYGFAQKCIITATATPTNQIYNVPASLTQIFQVASIPVFQFAIFYNIDLEIDPGAGMTVNGPVFSNAGLWSGNGNITYNSTVRAVNNADTSAQDPFCNPGKSDTGTPAGNFLVADQPKSGAHPLNMPIGTNNDPAVIQSLLAIPPSGYAMGTDAAYSTNGQMYLANGADLVVSNSVSGTNVGAALLKGTNFTVYVQNSLFSPHMRQVTNDFYLLKTGGSTNWIRSTNGAVNSPTNIQYAGYSFLTNVAFYDYREGKTVQAVQINVSNFIIWRTNVAVNGGSNYNTMKISAVSKGLNSIYVYNSVSNKTGQLPAVRMINGQRLPSDGLTVATPFPMYVKGDYNIQTTGVGSSAATTNTAYTYPAALMADAITILSDGWKDSSYISSTSVSSRTPVVTTINAAALEGIVPSSGGNYSGGVENFLRLLENWNNIKLWYNGSIVVMFPSQYATSRWVTPGTGTGNYYQAPLRQWGFDTNFNSQPKLPPLTPQTKAVIRSSWSSN